MHRAGISDAVRIANDCISVDCVSNNRIRDDFTRYNTGQTLVKHWSNNLQPRQPWQVREQVPREIADLQPAGVILVKYWSNTGQTLVKHQSDSAP